MDRIQHDDSAGAGARLTAEPERALEDQRRGGVEIGVLGDYDGVLAAHLELDAALGSDLAVNQPANLGRAGERYRRNARVGGDGRASDAVALHQRDRVRRQPAVQQRFHEALTHQRGELRRLEQHGVSCGKSGPDLARRDVERKVPRGDGPDDADRFTQREHQIRACHRIRHTGGTGGFPCIEPKVRRCPAHLHRGLGGGLAFLADQLCDEQRRTRLQLRRSRFQDRGAALRRGGRPLGGGLVERVNGGADVGGG